MMHSSDYLIDNNIDKIKKNAIDLKNRKIETFEDSLKFIRFWLAEYYRIPSKSPIFDEYTVEELFFEYYFLTGVEEKKDAAAVVREAAKDLSDLFSKEFSAEENAAMDKIFENDVNWTLDDLK